MTDQSWENEETLLSRKLIGKISNMKNFWNSVSDEDSIVDKKQRIKQANKDPFAGKEFLQENIKHKKQKYANLMDRKHNHDLEFKGTSSQNNILEDIEVKRKIKCERGNTKDQLSFWEGVLEERSNLENEKTTERDFPGLRNITASTIQGKQSFWNDVSENKMWETKQLKKQESQAELHSVRPQQQRVDLMIGEWQDNIKPFIKATERANESRKLKENIRLKTTGIKVDELAKRWEGMSDDLQDATKITEDLRSSKTGFLENLMLEDDLKESILRKRQLWHEAVLKGKGKTMSDISSLLMNEMSDVELLCQSIHICGEDYLTQDHSFLKMITFQRLAQVFPRDDLAGALADGHKYTVISYDGEVEDFEPDTHIILKIPIEEIVEAFNEMKSRNPNIYRSAREKSPKGKQGEIGSESDDSE